MLRLLLIVLSAANSYASYECGVPHFPILDKSGTNRIVGGWEARPHSIPWHVHLIRYKPNSDQFITCGGSLIEVDGMNGTDLVLTAAHCLEDRMIYAQSEDISVLVGAHKIWSEETSRREIMVKTYAHHNYRRDDHANDIALLKLKEEVAYTEYTRPVCLPSENQELPINSKCFVSGWGKLSEAAFGTEALRMVDVKIFPDEKCELSDDLRKVMFCAGHEEGRKDACFGDSGGPLMCEKNGKWIQFGIISNGEGCGRKGEPGIYTKVPKYIRWIKLKTRKFYLADGPAAMPLRKHVNELKFDGSSYV